MKYKISQRPEVLFNCLKEILKTRKINYRDLAQRMDTTENAIKYLFHRKDAPVSKIMAICEIIDINFQELVQIAYSGGAPKFSFTQEQEHFFARNTNFFSFFCEIYFNHLTPAEVAARYGLNKKSMIKYLSQLEKLKVIEVYPNDRVRFCYSGGLTWIPNGPWIKTFYGKKLELIKRRLEIDANSEIDQLFSINFATFSERTRKMFVSELKEFEEKYRKIAHFEYHSLDEKNRVPLTWALLATPHSINYYETKISNLD